MHAHVEGTNPAATLLAATGTSDEVSGEHPCSAGGGKEMAAKSVARSHVRSRTQYVCLHANLVHGRACSYYGTNSIHPFTYPRSPVQNRIALTLGLAGCGARREGGGRREDNIPEQRESSAILGNYNQNFLEEMR